MRFAMIVRWRVRVELSPAGRLRFESVGCGDGVLGRAATKVDRLAEHSGQVGVSLHDGAHRVAGNGHHRGIAQRYRTGEYALARQRGRADVVADVEAADDEFRAVLGVGGERKGTVGYEGDGLGDGPGRLDDLTLAVDEELPV